MLRINKKVGETPLQLLERIRKEKPELKDERLSYAGRLDPMAEGEMIILVGDENNEREKYLKADKEYEATFLVGFETDTGDVLGKITNSKNQIPPLHQGFEGQANPKQITNYKSQTENLKKLETQKYPWFSGKTVNGKKLFEYFKEGKVDFERPELKVEVESIELRVQSTERKEDLKKYIFESINKVKGDFRQKEILEGWRAAFERAAQKELKTFTIKTKVSSGTFIRAFCEEFDFPCCLLNLKRTKVFL